MSNQLSPENLCRDIRIVLQQWAKPDATAGALNDLRIVQTRRRKPGNEALDPAATAITSALVRLEETHPELAAILKSHYLKGETTVRIAMQHGWSKATANRRLGEAVAQLSDVLYQEEVAARAAFDAELSRRMGPPGYSQLFGIDAALGLLGQLLQPGSHAKIILLTGTGGIGKTSVADALVRRIAYDNRFADFAWVTAKQHLLNPDGGVLRIEKPALTADECIERLGEQLLEPEQYAALRHSTSRILGALGERLAALPHLVVIDNLETLADVDELLPLLRQLAGPTRFLLTSRQSLPSASDVRSLKVAELSEADALALLRAEAISRNLDFIAAIDDRDLQPVYRVVGGNPLALRLVVGQLCAHDLDVILEKLLEAEGRPIENLYDFIYYQAWDGLKPAARAVLLAMPLVPPAGGTYEQIVALCGLPERDVYNGIFELVMASLIDRKGGLNEVYYSIHALTRSFLHKGILRWQES